MELLERLQINHWLLMEAIQSQNYPMTTCLIFSYVLNYGFALLGLYLFAFVSGALFIANLLEVSAQMSTQRPRSSRENWSLVAITVEFKDKRVSHLRSLWIKQLEMIDSNGGLALKMFSRINVTYVQIIESFLWATSCWLLFAFGMKGR